MEQNFDIGDSPKPVACGRRVYGTSPGGSTGGGHGTEPTDGAPVAGQAKAGVLHACDTTAATNVHRGHAELDVFIVSATFPDGKSVRRFEMR